MRRVHGYAVTVEPGKQDVEEDTLQCGHCGGVIFVQPRQDPAKMGGFCRCCMRHLCRRCAAVGRCEPFERQIEEQEAWARFLSAALG